jgi:phospholipid/cholesterol/gamma-HCH transport system substrate-binding protein
METRSNHILVGAVVLALLMSVIGFTAWITGRGGGSTKDYDIFFKQSVAGLDVGSTISFNGVAAGKIKDIEIWDPEFVRVRISIRDTIPVLLGTTAAVQGVGFTGGSQITLSGAVKGAPPIIEKGPDGVPVIPTRTAGLGALLNNAPQLVERLSTLTERLTELMSDQNQRAVGSILGNTEKVTKGLTNVGPQMDAVFSDARVAVRQAAIASQQIGRMAGSANGMIGSTNRLINEDARGALGELNRTVVSAQKTLAGLDAAVSEVKPGLRAVSTQTVPEISQLVRDLRAMSDAMSSVAAKIDQQGIGTIIGGPKLPDYVPAKEKK